jgi:hypothetical protein
MHTFKHENTGWRIHHDGEDPWGTAEFEGPSGECLSIPVRVLLAFAFERDRAARIRAAECEVNPWG